MDFLDSMMYIGLTVSTFIMCRLILHDSKDKSGGHYTRPAWNFALKRFYAEYKIRQQQENERKTNESEAPKVLPNEESTDSQQISGNDEHGNSLLIKFTRKRHRVAEVWLLLRLANGQVYTLPNQPNTSNFDATPKIFEAAGLKLECLVPFGKWRITFSGILRRGIAQSDNQAGDLFYSKFNFIWVAASDPMFWPYDWSPKLIANSLATEKWRDGNWMNLILLKDSGGHDQFGACHGQVKIYDSDPSAYVQNLLPKSEDFELNLPGIRQRRWGPNKNDHLHRRGVLMGTIKDGVVFEVGAISGKTGLTHTQFGNLRFPDGRVVPIESTDFHLASLGENQENLPQAAVIKMKAEGKNFEAMITFKNNLKVPFNGEESRNAFVIPIEIKFNNFEGFGSAIFWYPENNQKLDIQEIPTAIKRIFNSKEPASPEKLLVSFTDKEAQSVLVSGGKGSSLAILNSIQEINRNQKIATEIPDYFVPEGFNVSVSAYERHLRNNPSLLKALRDLEDVAFGKISESLKDACAKVQKAFVATKLDNHLAALISEKLKLINVNGSERYAARSSGVTEDCEESSAAGQNETFLGLKTDEDVFTAVVKCWASLYGFQSVQYRKQHIQPIRTSMSVVVQKMVAAEAAGVLFTRHPVNGDISVTIITANYGLGESVVSAKSEPDTFYIRRTISDELEFLGSKAGAKKTITVMNSEASIEEIDLPESKRSQLCLSKEACLKLARLGVIMEKYFGTARDIEFAVTKDEKIYLLQSRPITALNSFTEYEMIHESDSAIMSPNDCLTKANVGEIILGSSSVFAQTVLWHFIERNTFKMIYGTQRRPTSVHNMFFTLSHQQAFMNVGKLFYQSIGKTLTKDARVSATSIFGFDVYEKYPQLFELAQHQNSFKGGNNFVIIITMLYRAFFRVEKHLTEMNERCEKLEAQLHRENLKKLKATKDVLNIIENSFQDLEIVIDAHLVASNASSITQMFAFNTLVGKSDRLTNQANNDIALVLGSISEVESANVPVQIQGIAGTIMMSNKHEEFLKVDRKQSLGWLKENCKDGFEKFDDFMKRHGHRSINELDFISTPWMEEPELIIDMIKTNLKSSSIVSVGVASKHQTNDDDIVDTLKSPLGFVAKFLLRKFFLPRCRKGVQDREKAKSKLVFAVNEIRQAVKYLAEKMVSEGLLPDKSLIFHLSPMEIREIINSNNARIIQKAIRRQKQFPKLNELKFSEIAFGAPKPLENTIRDANFTSGDVLVSGVPVCSGVVTGRACVCKSFADAENLQKGDILITYGTDIGWSPYFPILSGICTEIGGLISHGAVVAREFSLPCIVGATFATDIIKDGQQIIMNASDGTISAA